MQGMTASMTNTGFVALPILHSIYGQPAVLPAAVATVFVAAAMFPATVILLAILVGLLLLLGWANLASVLVARAAAREGELAVKAALGASRAALLRERVAETIVLCVLGGGVGLVLGRVATRILIALALQSGRIH